MSNKVVLYSNLRDLNFRIYACEIDYVFCSLNVFLFFFKTQLYLLRNVKFSIVYCRLEISVKL